MTKFAFGPCRLTVDVKRTRDWYAAHGEVAGGCDCAYCRNFTAAVETVSPEIRDFFDALGLDIRKPREAMELGPRAEGHRLYENFYHLAGTLETNAPDRLEIGEAEAGFSPDCDLLPEDFPRPCFQLNVAMELPWLLENPALEEL